MKQLLLTLFIFVLAVDMGTAATLEDIRKKAESGNLDAQVMLCVEDFGGGDKNRAVPDYFDWCQKAASRGDPRAQGHLGVIYLGYLEVAEDIEKAYIYISLGVAGEGMSPNAKQETIDGVLIRLADHLTPAQLAKADKEIERMLKTQRKLTQP